MRIRATVAAVSGALALSAFAMPAAHAADSSWGAASAKVIAAHSGKTAFSSTAAAADLGVTFSDLKIAKAVKVGITNHVSTTVTYTMTHGANYDLSSDDFDNGPLIYKGSLTAPDNVLGGTAPATCTAVTDTTATCSGKIDIYPGEGDLINSDAGQWSAGAIALQYSTGDYSEQGDLGSTLVQRYSKLTVNAGPEPVAKGKTITSTGKLSRANWEDNQYHGYSTQPVKLQFRKKGSSTYTTVKTIKTSTTGALKTTVKATVDGYFRYSFAGTSTTPTVTTAGDFVDVR
jgi:hypothetical protein